MQCYTSGVSAWSNEVDSLYG